VGCHSTTPDPKAVSFNNFYPWPVQLAGVSSDTTGQIPAYMTPTSQLALGQAGLGMQATSKAHYKTGDRKLITTYKTAPGKYFNGYTDFATTNRLAIFDLESTVIDAQIATYGTTLNSNDINTVLLPAADGKAWTYLATGETHAAVAPSWSHDGNTIAYTSTYEDFSGRLGPDGPYPAYNVGAIIKTVPYSNGAGGTATGLAGANDTSHYQYYPSFSPDDTFLAFNRHPKDPNDPQETKGYGGIYSMQRSEIYLTKVDGSLTTPIRLSGNDPATCGAGVQYVSLLGVNSKTTWQQTPAVAILPSQGSDTAMTQTGNIYPAGVWNSWARWSPESPTRMADGRKFYWIVFASARDAQTVPACYPNETPVTQLYLAAIVVDKAGNVTTYPAIYIWNQANMATTQAGTAFTDGSVMTGVTPSWDDVTVPSAAGIVPPN
jgi:hypothetical protein